MRHAIGRFLSGLVLVTGVGAGAGLAAAFVAPSVAGAVATFTVNDVGDFPVLDGIMPGGETTCTSTNVVNEVATCTLRAAIEAADNLGSPVAIILPNPLDATIVPGSAYVLDDSLGQLLLEDSGGVTINGAGQGLVTIEAATTVDTATTRVLKVENGSSADISGVTIANGVGNNGGGILDCGDMTLTDTTVTDNAADETGGGIEVSQAGSATLTDDTVSDNTAGGEQFDNGIFNEAGGGIADENPSASATSNLTVTDSTITGNTAISGDGGGILAFNTDDSEDVFDPNLTVDISDSTVDGNFMDSSDPEVFGGGLSAEDGVWNVTGTTINDNGPTDGSFDLFGGGVEVFVPGLSATFANDEIKGNSAYDAGGIEIDGGDLSITNTSIANNHATEAFAGVLDEQGEDEGGSTAITSSTISGNSIVQLVGESAFLGDGGGITALGCEELALTNDTIAGNSAPNEGGGYYSTICGQQTETQQSNAINSRVAHAQDAHAQPHQSELTTTFLFDTLSGNSTGDSTGGGNIQQDDDSTITMADTIVAGGTVGATPTTNCEFSGDGTLTSLGHNLIDDTTCGTPGTGDIIGQGAQLGALGDNGGPTQTELPATTSPAVGGVPSSVCSATGVSTDQRGVARGAGPNGSCTIGAVEVAGPPTVNPNGYRLVADEGGIFDFGLNFHGSLANNHLNAPIVGIANSPGFDGYLMAGGDGGVFALGGANFYGSLGGQAIPSPIAAIAAPPSENGYWLVAQNGQIYNFGSSPALPALSLPAGAHIVGMASTQDGGGAWLTDQLGDVYAEGDAHYVGGLGGVHLNKPIVGIAAAASGQGYVLAASDGGVFNYGTQGFFGSVPGSLAPGQSLVAPIVGIAVTHSGKGYWLVGSDGGVFNYGDAPFLGSIYTAIGNHPLNGPIVGIQHLGEPST